jgi:uncharacterized protein YggE
MTRTHRAPVSLVLLLTLGACGERSPDPRGLEPGETLLSVSGTGRAERRPDQALFTAGLENVAPTPEAASASANQAVARIVSALKAQGVAEKDVQTSSLSISRIGYGKDRGRFQASNTVTVKVRQVDKAGAVIAAATGAGANVLSGPNLSVADPEAATLSAHGAAYKAARAKAEAYAKAAGMRVSRVVEIQDGGQGGAIPMMYAEEARDAMMVAPPPVAQTAAPVMTGTNSATITARVVFALRPV